MSDKVDGLIEILLDPQAREDERDDAASYLGKYDDAKALNALVKVGSSPLVEDMVLDSCGESIAEILVRRNQFNKHIIDLLVPTARRAACAVIQGQKPEWLQEF